MRTPYLARCRLGSTLAHARLLGLPRALRIPTAWARVRLLPGTRARGHPTHGTTMARLLHGARHVHPTHMPRTAGGPPRGARAGGRRIRTRLAVARRPGVARRLDPRVGEAQHPNLPQGGVARRQSRAAGVVRTTLLGRVGRRRALAGETLQHHGAARHSCVFALWLEVAYSLQSSERAHPCCCTHSIFKFCL